MVADLVVDGEVLVSAAAVLSAAAGELAGLVAGTDVCVGGVGGGVLGQTLAELGELGRAEEGRLGGEMLRVGAGFSDAVAAFEDADSRLAAVSERVLVGSPAFEWGM